MEVFIHFKILRLRFLKKIQEARVEGHLISTHWVILTVSMLIVNHQKVSSLRRARVIQGH